MCVCMCVCVCNEQFLTTISLMLQGGNNYIL